MSNESSKLNIIIPMSGAGSRFKDKGYNLPKPFIRIKNKMMIEHVLDGVRYDNADLTLIIQSSFEKDYQDELNYLAQRYKGLQYSTVTGLTQGAACTVLSIYEKINHKNPILICDCDNIIQNDTFSNFINFSMNSDFDGVLLTVNSNKNSYSYAKVDDNDIVSEIKEKEVISHNAIAGFYFLSHGSEFVKNAIDIMIYGARDKNEFYISSVYQNLINNNKKIAIYNTDNVSIDCVGTPEQLSEFLKELK